MNCDLDVREMTLLTRVIFLRYHSAIYQLSTRHTAFQSIVCVSKRRIILFTVSHVRDDRNIEENKFTFYDKIRTKFV